MWQLLVMVGGFIATLTITARTWEARPLLRCLPIVYGVLLGLTIEHSDGGLDVRKVIEGVAAGLVLGLLGTFAIWIESRSER